MEKRPLWKEDREEEIVDEQPVLKTPYMQRLEKSPPKDLGDFLDEDDYDDDEEYEEEVRPKKRKNRSSVSLKAKVQTFFVLLFLVIGLILIFKPILILNPLKSFVNGSYGNEIPEYESYENLSIEENISIEGGNASLVLNEAQIVFLINKVKQEKKSIDRIEIGDGNIVFMKNMAKNDNPLWLLVEIKKEEDRYIIEHVGFGKIGVPEVLKEKIMQSLLDKVISLDDSNMFGTILGDIIGNEFSSLIDTNNIVLVEDNLTLKIVESDFDIDFEDIVNKFEDLDLGF